MRASTIAAILAFTATALSAPTKSSLAPVTKRQVFGRDTNSALNDCSNAADQFTCVRVVNTIANWDGSVNNVNNFLNVAGGLSGSDLTNLENSALGAANAEPGFLQTLSTISGLSQAGQDAATQLGNVFPKVPQNLGRLLDGSGFPVQSAIDAINDARCPPPVGTDSILVLIGTLWQEAAAAAGADTPGFPLGPNVCAKDNGNSGDAFN